MDVLGIALAAVLAFLTIVFVARPFLRTEKGEAGPSRAPSAPRQAVFELLEQRDRALLALQELDTDLRAGMISPAEHGRLIRPLQGDAAKALRELAELPSSRQELRETESADSVPDRPRAFRPKASAARESRT
jgi:hypothetical protein